MLECNSLTLKKDESFGIETNIINLLEKIKQYKHGFRFYLSLKVTCFMIIKILLSFCPNVLVFPVLLNHEHDELVT